MKLFHSALSYYQEYCILSFFTRLLSTLGRPMVVSSGMQSMETMRQVYQTVKEHNQKFAILQCTSAYPLEAEDVNLRVITVGKSVHKGIPFTRGHG